MKVPSSLQIQSFAGCVWIAVSLSGCGERKDQVAWWTGEQQRMELTHQVELQQFRCDQVYSGDYTELASFRTGSQATSARAAALRQKRDELTGLVESQQKKLVEFQESTLRSQRQRAMRLTYETFRTATGRSFKKVSISAIDDSGVTIRHADGSTRLRFADLDAQQQQFFGLEADLALIAQQKEAREAVAYERWIAKELEISHLSDAAVAKVSVRNEATFLPKLAESPVLQIVAANVRPLSQPAKSFGSVGYRSYRYSTYRSYRPIYQTNFYDTSGCMNYPTAGITPCPSQHCPVEYFPHPVEDTRRTSFANTTIPSNP